MKRTLGDASHQVSDAQAGQALERVVRDMFEGASWNAVRRLIETGKVSIDGRTELDARTQLLRGWQIVVKMNAQRPGRASALPESALVYVDNDLVVVSKPAGISSVPFDENESGTLDELVRAALKRGGRQEPPLGVVHRLDKETSGLLLFARNLRSKRALKQMFRFHTIQRRYWAIVHGRMGKTTLRSRLVKDRGDGRRGSTENPILGREAVTHVRAIEELAGATLVECRLETGRTHQIRIHLAEAGHPLVGERVYVKGYRGTLITAPRMMLHAFELGFEHPTSGKPLSFEQPLPEDMQRMLQTLRRS